MNIVGKFFNITELSNYVRSLTFTGWTPQFVVVHNTSAPNLAQYRDWLAHPQNHGGWTHEGWLRNLQSYYTGLGWSGGPHAFVCPDGVGLFTPFTQHGTHSPAWNSFTWGIETVGEYESEPFDNGTRDNLIATLGILHSRIGLNPTDYKFGVRGIHFHKEDPKTTHKTCPGHIMVKEDLVAAVADYMSGSNPGEHAEIPPAVHVAPTSALSVDELNSPIWLQSSLTKLGYGLVIDGNLGPKTRAAVTAFQTKNSLVSDGIAGPITRLTIKNQLSLTP